MPAVPAFSRSRVVLFLGFAMAAASCSRSGDDGLQSPVAPGGSLTMTITTAGVSPKTLTVAAGSQVLFINNDVVAHEMFSDPHPEHMDCPELNQVGFLTPGQSRQSGNLNTPKTCGYHDHDDSLNSAFQGTITISN